MDGEYEEGSRAMIEKTNEFGDAETCDDGRNADYQKYLQFLSLLILREKQKDKKEGNQNVCQI